MGASNMLNRADTLVNVGYGEDMPSRLGNDYTDRETWTKSYMGSDYTDSETWTKSYLRSSLVNHD